jgi:hypothetical protein
VRIACKNAWSRAARALQFAAAMRAVWIVFAVACGGHQSTWTALEPPELGDCSEAFVLIGMNALHLSHVERMDGTIHARVVRVWELPPVGAYALGNDSGSPEDIAHRAGWRELRVANARIDAPVATIRSARAKVGVEDDEPAWSAEDHPILIEVVGDLLDAALTYPR